MDLNRDFPDPIQRGAAGVVEPSGSEQPETLALMRWTRHGRFTVSASMHEVPWIACLGVTYPHSRIVLQQCISKLHIQLWKVQFCSAHGDSLTEPARCT